MKLVFSRGHNIVSDMICSLTGEPSSHFSVLLYENSVPLILQSNFLGVDFQSYKMFCEKESIVATIDKPMSQTEEDLIFDSIVNGLVGESYDFGALAYVGWRVALNRVFSIPIPNKNRWSSTNKAICVNLASSLPDQAVPESVKSLDLSMVTPWELYHLLGGA